MYLCAAVALQQAAAQQGRGVPLGPKYPEGPRVDHADQALGHVESPPGGALPAVRCRRGADGAALPVALQLLLQRHLVIAGVVADVLEAPARQPAGDPLRGGD